MLFDWLPFDCCFDKLSIRSGRIYKNGSDVGHSRFCFKIDVIVTLFAHLNRFHMLLDVRQRAFDPSLQREAAAVGYMAGFAAPGLLR